jgi:hypothetical protein
MVKSLKKMTVIKVRLLIQMISKQKSLELVGKSLFGLKFLADAFPVSHNSIQKLKKMMTNDPALEKRLFYNPLLIDEIIHTKQTQYTKQKLAIDTMSTENHLQSIAFLT